MDKVIPSTLGQRAMAAQPGIACTGYDSLTEAPQSNLGFEGAFLDFCQTSAGESLFGRPIIDHFDAGDTR
jgi:hypothetical protein